jgi:hypothetical protein
VERQFTVRAPILRRVLACHNCRVSVLRMTSLAVMALWIGGLSALVAVASPSISSVLGEHDTVGGPPLATLIAGDMFGRFQHASWFFGGSLIVLLGLRAALGPRPRRLAVQMGLVGAMLLASAFVLSTGLIALTLSAGLAVFFIEAKD